MIETRHEAGPMRTSAQSTSTGLRRIDHAHQNFRRIVHSPLLAGAAGAQTSVAAAPRIEGFDVDPSRKSPPGNELAFTLYGTPGGTANVRVGGATAALILVESEAGRLRGRLHHRPARPHHAGEHHHRHLARRQSCREQRARRLAEVGAAPRWPGDVKAVAAPRLAQAVS